MDLGYKVDIDFECLDYLDAYVNHNVDDLKNDLVRLLWNDLYPSFNSCVDAMRQHHGSW